MILLYNSKKKLVGGISKHLFDTMQKTPKIDPLAFLTLHKFLHYIGIDPDIEASGFAWWNKREQKLIACTTYNFFDLQCTLKFFTDDNLLIADTIVHIEGSWLESKANWHKDKKETKVRGEIIAEHVGQNHAVGKLICEMCQMLELSFIVRKIKSPLFANKQYFQQVTKWDSGDTNADARSAANYVYSL